MNAATAMAERALIMTVPCHGPLRPVVSLAGLVTKRRFPDVFAKPGKWFRPRRVLFRRRHRDETLPACPRRRSDPKTGSLADREIKSRPEAGTGPACRAARGGLEGLMPRIALYPGSFDPVTNGHLDVVRHAVGLCDRLIVAIGVHPGKKPLFSTEERLDMVRAVFEPVAAEGRLRLRLHDLRQSDRHRGAEGRRHHHDSRPARRHRPRLRDADRRHERDHGARGAHRVRSGLGRRSARSPPHWCAKSRPWAATSRRSCRLRSRPASRPNSPASARCASPSYPTSDPEFS